MLSSDKNVETIAQLIEVLKHYFGLQKEYLKLDVIDKVVRLLTATALAIVFFLLVIAILTFIYGDNQITTVNNHKSMNADKCQHSALCTIIAD